MRAKVDDFWFKGKWWGKEGENILQRVAPYHCLLGSTRKTRGE